MEGRSAHVKRSTRKIKIKHMYVGVVVVPRDNLQVQKKVSA